MLKKLLSGLVHLALFLVLAGVLDNARSLCFPPQNEPSLELHTFFDSLYILSDVDRSKIKALEIRLRVAETAIRQIAIQTEIESIDTVASFGATSDSLSKSIQIYGQQNDAGIRHEQPALLRFNFSGHSCDFRNVQY